MPGPSEKPGKVRWGATCSETFALRGLDQPTSGFDQPIGTPTVKGPKGALVEAGHPLGPFTGPQQWLWQPMQFLEKSGGKAYV